MEHHFLPSIIYMQSTGRFHHILLFLFSGVSLFAQDILEPDKYETVQVQIEHELDSLFHYSSLAYLQPDAFKLSESDVLRFAELYDIEPSAVMAVLDIEAGKTHNGFSEPRLPLINFDTKLFQKKLIKAGVNVANIQKQYPELFSTPDIKKYGTKQRAEHAQLAIARQIDDRLAIESTFWGMFQIGGFNWKKCGSKNIDEFVEDMSRSERDQLALFGVFLKNTDMLDSVRKKQWDKFARAYNGPKYHTRGYDRRLQQAYNKHKQFLK